MASEIDICNLALSHLGDNATVASIDPPEGSAQAEHCARFYPMARDALLELHHWKFATRRANLALLNAESWSWSYAYAAPSLTLKLLAVLPAGASSDADGEDYEIEGAADGSVLILLALSWQLASMLAGPILKGDAGAAEAKRCAGMAQSYLAKAAESDANQRKVTAAHSVPWMAGR
jgi:hypothetical protein